MVFGQALTKGLPPDPGICGHVSNMCQVPLVEFSKLQHGSCEKRLLPEAVLAALICRNSHCMHSNIGSEKNNSNQQCDTDSTFLGCLALMSSCNALRTQPLYKYLSFRSPPPYQPLYLLYLHFNRLLAFHLFCLFRLARAGNYNS